MVETALLVAIIGIAGTLTASILTVLSEPWRRKRERIQERTLRQESIRKALYSELAQIAVKLQTATIIIHDTEERVRKVEKLHKELDDNKNGLDKLKKKLDTATKARKQKDQKVGSMLGSMLTSAIFWGTENAPEMIDEIEQAVRTVADNRANVSATFELLFNLKGGIYKLVKSDPELAVLFYELPEAYVVDSFYSIVDNYTGLASLSEDHEKQWKSVVSSFDKMRDVFLEGERSKRLDIVMLKRCCTLDSDRKHLDDLLPQTAE